MESLTKRIKDAAKPENNALFVLRGVFDATGGKGTGTYNIVDENGAPLTIPANTMIIDATVKVSTLFASADSTSTVALGYTGAAGAFYAATAVSGLWGSTGLKGTLINNPALGEDAEHNTSAEVAALRAATWLDITAEKSLLATVAVQALTAGKMYINILCLRQL